MTPESKVLRSICRRLDSLKPMVWYMKIRGGPYSQRGLPDLVVLACGKVFFVEVKSSKGHLSLIQGYVKASIEKAGGKFIVARSAADVLDMSNGLV